MILPHMDNLTHLRGGSHLRASAELRVHCPRQADLTELLVRIMFINEHNLIIDITSNNSSSTRRRRRSLSKSGLMVEVSV